MTTDAQRVLAEHPEWFHSITLAPGVVTPGRKTAAVLADEWQRMALPSLAGKRVLDIGAYDGYFSFAAERAGAREVVALDHYVWSVDPVAYAAAWRRAREGGPPVPPPHLSAHWDPVGLPGRAPFDAARAALGSTVVPVVGDFATMDLAPLGTFDVVLFLGVLYHLEEPLTSLRRLRSLVAPGGRLVVETEAVAIPGAGGRSVCEFFPAAELNDDPSNWWVPNATALAGLCTGAGFAEARVVSAPWNGWRPLARAGRDWARDVARGRLRPPVVRYRAVVHATT